MHLMNLTKMEYSFSVRNFTKIHARLVGNSVEITCTNISDIPLYDTHFFTSPLQSLTKYAINYSGYKYPIQLATAHAAHLSILAMSSNMPMEDMISRSEPPINSITDVHISDMCLAVNVITENKAVYIVTANDTRVKVDEVDNILSFMFAKLYNIDFPVEAQSFEFDYDDPLSLILLPEESIVEICDTHRKLYDNTDKPTDETRRASSLQEWIAKVGKETIPTFFL